MQCRLHRVCQLGCARRGIALPKWVWWTPLGHSFALLLFVLLILLLEERERMDAVEDAVVDGIEVLADVQCVRLAAQDPVHRHTAAHVVKHSRAPQQRGEVLAPELVHSVGVQHKQKQ